MIPTVAFTIATWGALVAAACGPAATPAAIAQVPAVIANDAAPAPAPAPEPAQGLWFRQDDGRWASAAWACELADRVLVMTTDAAGARLLIAIDRADPELRRVSAIDPASEGCAGMMKCYWEAPTAAPTERFIVEYADGVLRADGRVAPDAMGGGETCIGPADGAVGERTSVCITAGTSDECLVRGVDRD